MKSGLFQEFWQQYNSERIDWNWWVDTRDSIGMTTSKPHQSISSMNTACKRSSIVQRCNVMSMTRDVMSMTPQPHGCSWRGYSPLITLSKPQQIADPIAVSKTSSTHHLIRLVMGIITALLSVEKIIEQFATGLACNRQLENTIHGQKDVFSEVFKMWCR